MIYLILNLKRDYILTPKEIYSSATLHYEKLKRQSYQD